MGKTYPQPHPFHCNNKLMTYLDELFKWKYFRLTANSCTSYEQIIKVPASVTLDDIQKLKADDHLMFDGAYYSDVNRSEFGTSADWEYGETQECPRPDSYELKIATEFSLEDLNLDKEKKTHE